LPEAPEPDQRPREALLSGILSKLMIAQNRIGNRNRSGVIPPAQLTKAVDVAVDSGLNQFSL
jgi:hypothetical protein